MFWQRKCILVMSVNHAVVQVLTSGKTKDPFLVTCARDIWFVAALADIELVYKHMSYVETME